MTHPLRHVCLSALIALLLTQLGLMLVPGYIKHWYWILLLSFPLVLPLKGFISNNLYTYKWTGFLTLLYFCIGISELVSNPQLRLYAYITTTLSTILFVSVIYYSRWLGIRQSGTSQ